MLRYYILVVFLVSSVNSLHGQSLLSLDGSHRMRSMAWDEGLWGTEGASLWCVLNRTRMGLTLRPTTGFELRAALLNEFTTWIEDPADRSFNIDEVVFEHLYARWRDTLGVPFDLTVGRQDMKLGDGFLIMDGSPLDGSRSVYVNGARANLFVGARERLSLFYLHQPERDDLLPILNDRSRALAEYSRDVVGGSFSCGSDSSSLDFTVLRAEGEWWRWIYDDRVEDPRERTYTAGARVKQLLFPGLSMTGEIALQFEDLDQLGRDFGRSDIAALHLHLRWLPFAAWQDVALRGGMFSYPYGWDPLLGRWPMWNESVAFSRGILPAPALWQNIRGIFVEASVKPLPSLRTVTSLQFLDPASSHPLSVLYEAKSIGRLLALHVFWKPDLPLSGHLMLEHMWYDDSLVEEKGKNMRDSYLWFRAELLYTMSPVSLL